MLESFNLNNDLEYQKLSPEEQSARGILGRLKGVIADFKHPTRNGRKYTEDLWEQTFSNPIIKEKIENRCLFGELGHPVDRQEVDMEKIAICMAETPKKGSDGKLHAVFDILATPCGKILKTLCDYGCNIGISSRGTGETYSDYNGDEIVDKDTFECECWDAVLIPAVKEARLTYVNESLDTKKVSLKRALCEALESSSLEDKKIMESTLKDLDIDYSPERVDNMEDDEDNTAADSGASLVVDLQEALKANKLLESQLASLQEKLSVSYTKEAGMRDSISKYKIAIKSLTEDAKRVTILEQKVQSLEEDLSSKDAKIAAQQASIKRLQESRIQNSTKSRTLNEGLAAKDREISSLRSQVSSLNESIKTLNAETQKTQNSLVENIEELKKDSAIKHSEYSKKLKAASQLVEKYKGIANKAFGKYIESQANRIGVSKEEIKNRLSESCTFEEVDRICEELQTYRVNLSRLPFDVTRGNKVRMQVKESVEPIKPANRFEDEIDDQLKSLAGL